MAKGAGRAFVVKKGGTAIAAVRTKSVTFNGTLIDVTSDDDDGDVTYLADEFASKSLEISVGGLTDDDVLSDLAFSTTDSDKHLSDITLERPNGDAISGTFIITSYAENGSYDGAVEFTATLVRSGAHTFTPAA
jgi:predicted secreted protein